MTKVLNESFKSRMTQVMDQSQHTSADTGGEGAAYEFCQGLDSWEKQRECLLPSVRVPKELMRVGVSRLVFLIGEAAAREYKAWVEVKGKKNR